MKICHEVPLNCLEQATFNDYEYALAHNFSSERYIEFFRKAIKEGKEVYLDNSAFELGHSVDNDYLNDCLTKLDGKARLFLPDIVGDVNGTLNLTRDFIAKYQLQVEPWCVLQGKTKDEIEFCWESMLKLTNHIAIPYRLNINRKDFIAAHKEEIQSKGIKIHLLGIDNPNEISQYGSEIKSVDTSCPVVLGLLGKKLEPEQWKGKDNTPIWSFTVAKLPDLVYYNAKIFRGLLR